MNNFTQRIITGSVFVGVLISSAVFSKEVLAILFLVFTIVGTYEYYQIVSKKDNCKPNLIAGYYASISCYLLIVGISLFSVPIVYATLLIPVIGLVFVIELFRLKEDGFSNVLHTLMPIIYVSSPFALFIASNHLATAYSSEYNAHFTLTFFFVLWANDTGAYLSGRAFGKTKLFPQISPNKTWEGTIGGALVALTIGYICSLYFAEFTTAQWLVISAIVVVFGSLGDLVESMLKRNYKVKDSGTILPGHGGILDRFDGLLIASPLVFTFVILIRFLF